MSKELEALKIGIPKLKKLYENSAKKMNKNDILGFDLTFVYLDKALQRLESIDNTKPSDVSLIWLNQRITRLEDDLQHYTMVEKDKALASITEKELNHLTSIKNYILKSQEQEKVLEIIIDREVSIQSFRRKNYKDYEDYCNRSSIYENSTPLTKEEFELLKRYFNEEKD